MAGWHACSTCALCQRLAAMLMHPVYNGPAIGNEWPPPYVQDGCALEEKPNCWTWSSHSFPIVVVAGQIAVVAVQTSPFRWFSPSGRCVGVTKAIMVVECVSGESVNCEPGDFIPWKFTRRDWFAKEDVPLSETMRKWNLSVFFS